MLMKKTEEIHHKRVLNNEWPKATYTIGNNTISILNPKDEDIT